MRKIVIYVVVGSDAGEAPGGVEIKVVRVQAENTRKSARQNVNKPFSSDAARKPVFALAFTQEETQE